MSQTQPAPHHIDPERLTREMNWNLLRTFVVLAESGSVTEAAEQLRLKQRSPKRASSFIARR